MSPEGPIQINMKKTAVIMILCLLCVMLAACGKGQTTKEDAEVDKAVTQAPEENAEGEEENPEEESFDYEAAYSTVLDRYKEAIAEKMDGTELGLNGMSPACEDFYEGDDPLANIGYAYLDINKDDMPELFIGSMDGSRVIEVYTIVDQSVVVVVSSSTNVDYSFYNNTMFGSCGVMSEKTIGYNYYLLNGTQLQFVEGVLEDSLFTTEMTWYKADSDDYNAANDTVITEEEAKKVIDYYEGMKTSPEYKAFSTYGQ